MPHAPTAPTAPQRPRRPRRAALALAPLVLVVVAACGGSADDGGYDDLSQAQLEQQVGDLMTDQATDARPAPDSVACEGGLGGGSDDEQRCVATIGDTRIGATVTRADDGGVDPVFDDGLLFAPDVIEPKLSQAITEQTGTLLDDVTCPDDLVGVPGQTMECRITTRGEELPVTITVTSSEGTDVSFDFTVEEPS